VTHSVENRRWILIIAVVLVVAVLVFTGYLIWRAGGGASPPEKVTKPVTLPRMANLPPKKPWPEPMTPSYPPDAPLLEQARKALREGIDAARAVALAKSLPKQPERDDAAFILLEYAAESGNAEAALEVARFYDPTFEGSSGTIQKDPAAAYEYYQVALAGGQNEAKAHLKKLRSWVEKEAAKGSAQAQELLRNWL